MKNTYIAIVVLVLIIAGVWFFTGRNNEVEAPVSDTGQPASGVSKTPATQKSGVSTSTTVKTGAVKEFIVRGANFSFDPATITVKKGDRVKITFMNTEGFHDFKIDEYGAATKQTQAPSTEVLEFVADKAGKFEYYCSVGSHKTLGMKGTLVVE